MDGEELFQRYDAGERDFSGADLREAGIFNGSRRLFFKDAIFKGVKRKSLLNAVKLVVNAEEVSVKIGMYIFFAG